MYLPSAEYSRPRRVRGRVNSLLVLAREADTETCD